MTFKSFSEDEFACKCGCGYNHTSPKLIQRLDHARELSGVPFVINSGSRCVTHNTAEGGSSTSSHIKGLAVDIACSESDQRYKILTGLIHAGFTRIGVAKTYIHVDIDAAKPTAVVWVY